MITPFLTASGAADADIYDIVDGTPLGRVLLTGDQRPPGQEVLTGLYLLDAGERSASVKPGWARRPGAFPAAERQLREYFTGTRTAFELPLAPRGTTFQLAVWAELARIPYGETRSYRDVARAIGETSWTSPRAVGVANGRNPISVIIPCHRVIGADGSMTGYGWGVERKLWLLRHEGALAAPAEALF